MDLNLTINLAPQPAGAGGTQTVQVPLPTAGGPSQIVLHFHINLPGADGGRQDEAPAGHLAAIAAAVACELEDQPHRILAVKPAYQSSAWSQEGRRAHFTSHAVR